MNKNKLKKSLDPYKYEFNPCKEISISHNDLGEKLITIQINYATTSGRLRSCKKRKQDAARCRWAKLINKLRKLQVVK